MIGAAHVLMQAPSGVTPLLDSVNETARAAFSLRKLRAAYAGSAVRIRRSSDNAEQDIGFTVAGDFDATAATTFTGAGNGFVAKWYDQTANTYDAAQAGASYQPKLVNSGTVYAGPKASTYSIYGWPNGSSGYAVLPFNTLGLRWPFTISAVVKFLALANQDYVVSHQSSGTNGTIYNRGYSNNWQTGVKDATNTRTAQKAVSTNTWYAGIFLCDAVAGNYNKAGLNGSALANADGTTSSGTNGAYDSALFCRNDSLDQSYTLNGNIAECVIWASALSDAKRLIAEASVNAYYAIY